MRHLRWRFQAGLALGVLLSAPAARAQQAATTDTSWVARSAIYEVFTQDFSPAGTLQGVTDGLDRIQASGANVIWLMPVQPVGILKHKGTLGSRYAIRDYMTIDSAYGTAADFRALVDAAHARGMKVILDWVPDHTAPDHPWVTQHPGWYLRDAQGNPSVPRERDGHLTDWTDVVQLDYRNAALRQAMLAAMRSWLTRYDLDGFRMDVAYLIPDDFWRQAIPALRGAVHRRILLLAESGDLKQARDGFDLIYAWASYARLKAVWQGAPAATFLPPEFADLRALPPGGARLRFTTNHDETAWDAPPVKLFDGPDGARAAFAAMALLPGRPLLYNGQEVESPQQLGLFEKEAIAWDQPDADQARAFYARVMRLDASDPSLLSRDLEQVTTTDPANLVAYRRGDLLVVVNTRDHPVQLTIPGLELRGARNLLTDEVMPGGAITLRAYGALVLRVPAP